MKTTAQDVAQHPATQITGVGGGLLALVLVLFQMGVFDRGGDDHGSRWQARQIRDLEYQVRDLETQVRFLRAVHGMSDRRVVVDTSFVGPPSPWRDRE